MFKEINKEDFNFKFLFLLLCMLPIAVVTSSLIMNLIVVLITLIFISIIIKNNEIRILKNKFFILLCLFYFYLFLNLKNSFDIDNSLSRTVGFVRFIFLSFAIKYVLSFKKFKYLKLILITWLSTFMLVSIDLFYEYIFGQNIMGYSNQFPGRLSGFLNDELKIGGYYFGFIILSISTLFFFFSKKIGIFFTILFFLISVMIGERANLIKIFLSLILFFLFIDFFSKKIKIFTLSLLILIPFFMISYNKNLNDRFNNQFIGYILNNGISNYYKISQYGAHYNSAIHIIKDYRYFGIGFQNFPKVCANEKYIDENFLFHRMRCSTHPHQTHLDIILSLGIVGYVFLISILIYLVIVNIRSYKKNKNPFTLAGICFILATFLTPLPAGSFFTSYGATIFWFNVGILLSFKNYRIKNFKKSV